MACESAAWLSEACRTAVARARQAGRLLPADVDRALVALESAALEHRRHAEVGTNRADLGTIEARSISHAVQSSRWITCGEAARLLNRSPRSVRDLASRGQLRGERDDTGSWHLDPDDVARMARHVS